MLNGKLDDHKGSSILGMTARREARLSHETSHLNSPSLGSSLNSKFLILT